MNLSISNIAWSAEHDESIYPFLQANGFAGLEVAPTRIFPEAPYDQLIAAKEWANRLKEKYDLVVPSMQSIWYGHTEKVFGTKEERNILIDYTKKAVLFAEAIGCGNLVFGNPKNRDSDDVKGNRSIAKAFFKEIGDFALEHHTVIALEANPIIYHTRFMNSTEQAVEMADNSNSEGIKVNVDLGTMLYNKEKLNYLKQIPEYIHHIHISEPGLQRIEDRKEIHAWLLNFSNDYLNSVYVSIEMGKQDIKEVKRVIGYIKGIAQDIQI
jgi:sugar phosphate isomerase/epimerase